MSLHKAPRITDLGLIACIDPANSRSFRGQNFNSLIHVRNWTVGSGSVSGYSQNGGTAENVRDYGEDPWGNQSIIWNAIPDAVSGPDGGWYSSAFSIDNTKMYRVSVWVKRTVYVDGRFYFGGYNYNASSNIVFYKRTGGSSTNCYPYVSSDPPSTLQLPQSTWVLVVYHVWPAGSGTGSNHVDSGRYTRSGGKYGNISYDLIFNPDATRLAHRTYLYYSASTLPRQHWCYPRVDLVDGTEPSIQQLLDGDPDSMYNLASSSNKGLHMVNGVLYDASDRSYILDGVKQYGMLPSSLEYELQQFTLSSWVKFDTLSDWVYLISKTQDSYNYGFRLEVAADGRIYIGIGNGTTVFEVVSDIGSVSINEWCKIDATYDQVDLKIYLNGENIKTEDNPGVSIAYDNTTFMVGYSEVTANRQFLDGKLGPIYVHSVALSDSELKQNFDATKGRFGL